jgi:mono/diheme cytochrome c family protein
MSLGRKIELTRQRHSGRNEARLFESKFLPSMNPRIAQIVFTVGLWLTLSTCSVVQAEDVPLSDLEQRGQTIFADNCAHCHGITGEGEPSAYSMPLVGDKSLNELTDYIDRTMPDDEAELCVGEDAAAVAAYISTAFYSEMAQVRNRPPRVELLHLTHRQYEESLADLFTNFSGQGTWSDERGLKGYFRSEKTKVEEVAPQIRFNYGDDANRPEELRGKESFGVSWVGGIFTEATGVYEFTIESTGGVELKVNGQQLIDAAVRSGDNTTFTASIRLLGGRAYPISVDYKHSKDEAGLIELYWTPPYKTQRPVTPKNLSTGWFPQIAVLDTAFPPDDSSYGYERGIGVSKAWDEATTRAAIECANYLTENLSSLSNTRKDDLSDEERAKRLRDFYRKFHHIAHRQVPSEADSEVLIDRCFDGDLLDPIGIKRFVLLVLKHPYFLYPNTVDPNTRAGAASRLALVVWDSFPNQRLRGWVDQGNELNEKELRNQAAWMVADRRTTNKLVYFLTHWMELERAVDVSKDQEAYAGFDRDLLADLRQSLELFVETVVTSEKADFRELLLADYWYVNQRIADYYDLDAAIADSEFQRVTLDSTQRSGIVTHPYLLSGLAYHRSSSPIHRGVFLARNVLGRTLRPPPIAVAPLDESLDVSLTTRERVQKQTQPESCQSCHTLINPLGFGLENYDAVGRFREQEKEKPIDATGVYHATTGESVEFSGPRELADFLVSHPDTHASFAEHVFHQFVQQSHYAYNQDSLNALVQHFRENDFNIRQLIVEVAVLAALPED